MEFAVNVNFFAKDIGMEKAVKYTAEAGFTYLDYTPPLQDDNWESIMHEHAEIFKANGLKVNQTHAPFNRYGRYGDKHITCMDRCMEATSFFGAKFVAVHGDEFDLANMEYSPEAAFEYNHNYFIPYVEYAAKNGFKMAFETVFEDGFKCPRFTSNPDDLYKLIKSYNSDSAVCCWDFGHANVSFRKTHASEILRFGSLIRCTHAHDNAGNDSHQMMTTGDINWGEVISAFKQIGFNDVFSIEYSHGIIPEVFVPEFISLTYRIAEHLWK